MRVHRTGGSCLRASQARRTRGAAHGEWVRSVDASDAEAVRASGREASRPPRTVLVGVARELGAAVVGISIWDSAEACHRFRDSDVEARRRAAMDPFVLEERSNFYTGRELGVPGR
jgi:hypothetical protein